MTKPIARDPIYRRRVFDAEIIELCVRWYITYRLSYRDLVGMMAERGVTVATEEPLHIERRPYNQS
jgi:transposase-like protein